MTFKSLLLQKPPKLLPLSPTAEKLRSAH
jgi:hypothetical protein